jgi:hypothetical protein
MKLEVECYSGRKADERPIRFRLNERQYLVEEVLDQWYGPQDVFFKLRADDGNLYTCGSEPRFPIRLGNWCRSAGSWRSANENRGPWPGC